MELRQSSPQDRVAPAWRIDVTAAAEKSYLLELKMRDLLVQVYAKQDNAWAKKYAQDGLQMPFGYLRELKLTVIKCMCNLRNWNTGEGRRIRYELRELLGKIELR